MKASTACLAATMLACSAPAYAEVEIKPFRSDLFLGCVLGSDIGAMTKVSNPLLLLGSVVYTGKVLNPDGTSKVGLVRHPMALPIVTSEAVSPDTTQCVHNVATNADGNISVLGLGINAARSDVYRISVHLVTRQKLATISENSVSLMPWQAAALKPQFRSIMAMADPSVTDFWIFDNISIYLLEVEKYKKHNSGILGAFGLVSGGANYVRDDTFKGTKIIVTGDPVSLSRSAFGLPVVTAAATPAVQIPEGAQSLRSMSMSEANSLRSTLERAGQ